MPHLDNKLIAAAVTILAKVFLILADTMPAPKAGCGYWMTWAYDAIQQAASNSGKVGERRTVQSKPAVQETQP